MKIWIPLEGVVMRGLRQPQRIFAPFSGKFMEGIQIPAKNLTQNGIEKPKWMAYSSHDDTLYRGNCGGRFFLLKN